MRPELLPDRENVFRFPVERRAPPTLNLLYDIGPDVRQVMINAQAFDLDMPPYDLRDQVDEATAAHIAMTVPPTATRHERAVILADMLNPVVAAAIAAARDASDAGGDLSDAEQRLAQAEAHGANWQLDPLRERVAALALRMAQQMVTAYELAEKAAGVSRAVRLARNEELWRPRDHSADANALFARTSGTN